MRITLESDYALRIITALAEQAGVVDAKTLSEKTSVTQRFTLKILHKLVGDGLVSSYKGVNGGYLLKETPDAITLKRVIELIDGPIVIARCLDNDELCSLNPDKSSCIFHHIFNTISIDVAKKLSKITIEDILKKEYSLS
jgi:Rrf2 family protein